MIVLFVVEKVIVEKDYFNRGLNMYRVTITKNGKWLPGGTKEYSKKEEAELHAKKNAEIFGGVTKEFCDIFSKTLICGEHKIEIHILGIACKRTHTYRYSDKNKTFTCIFCGDAYKNYWLVTRTWKLSSHKGFISLLAKARLVDRNKLDVTRGMGLQGITKFKTKTGADRKVRELNKEWKTNAYFSIMQRIPISNKEN